MTPRELILLSPYRVPAQNSLMLSTEDLGAFLNGYAALWHPAALAGAAGPPKIGSPYDYEQPVAGHVYAVPDNPPLMLPDDWEQRVRDAGAVAFHATSDRAETLANLKEALGGPPWEGAHARGGAFLGIGFGYVMVDALFEAMSHTPVLPVAEFWQEVQEAAAALADADPDAWRRPLQAAAARLLAAREVLYPVTIHLLDLCLRDERTLDVPLPASFEKGLPLNVVAAASVLEQLGQRSPERLAALRERVGADLVEVCGGPYVEHEDPLLPVESQVWNLVKGQAVYKRLLDQEVRVFARKRFGAHPHLPLLLNSVGIRRAALVAFDEALVPSYRVPVINWSSSDGKQLDAFTRTPYPADNPQTGFHFAHYLHETIRQDHAATLALLHSGAPAAPWYDDLLELSRFAPVLGQWTTLSRYLNEVLAGEYAAPSSPDEFHGDYLSDRSQAHSEHPVSGFARHARQRRRLDTAWTLAALSRGLAGRNDPLHLEARFAELEDAVERGGEEGGLTEIEQQAAQALADRLLARATTDQPGYLVLNPCSFARRVALELDGFSGPPPLTGPLKACQVDGATARLVVEVPALGFAWFPRTAAANPPAPPRMRLADSKAVRNEFFEAEVDPTTGGLRALHDHRTRVNRIGQQLVYNPGSIMLAKEIRVTSTGPALGEIVSSGTIHDEQERPLATFRQRFRAWLGRPVLELRVEIEPVEPPQGYPWYTYYGARFAWRDERAALLRGVNGTGYLTSHNRPETSDYLELRLGRQSTVLLTGGLPFHQRHGTRMLDVILLPEGETARAFDLALGLDRDYPMQTAVGMITPVPVVPTTKGPPHVGAAGWLFHLDAPNVLLTGMRPADGADAVLARLLECSTYGGHCELRCARDPVRGVVLDATGVPLLDASLHGDAVGFEVAPGDLAFLRVEFE
jgi:Glycosyl hydrolases family 38 N-terminal domain